MLCVMCPFHILIQRKRKHREIREPGASRVTTAGECRGGGWRGGVTRSTVAGRGLASESVGNARPTRGRRCQRGGVANRGGMKNLYLARTRILSDEGAILAGECAGSKRRRCAVASRGRARGGIMGPLRANNGQIAGRSIDVGPPHKRRRHYTSELTNYGP